MKFLHDKMLINSKSNFYLTNKNYEYVCVYTHAYTCTKWDEI